MPWDWVVKIAGWVWKGGTFWRRWVREDRAEVEAAFEQRIAILRSRLERAATSDDRKQIEGLVRQYEDDYLVYLTRKVTTMSRSIVAERAPAGTVTAQQPPLAEPQRRALERAASLFSVSSDAKTFDDLFRLGNAFYAAGSFERAREHYTAALALRPDDPATLNNRGAALAGLKRYEEALRDYNRSLEVCPDDPATLNNRGTALGGLKRYDEALRDYNRSLEVRPDHPATIYNLACRHSLRSRFDSALEELARAIAGDEKYRAMAREDEDFARLRQDPQWGPRFWALIGKEEP